ncbi:MAG: ABC transporter ATP-binding protein [Bacteroidota bacterium]
MEVLSVNNLKVDFTNGDSIFTAVNGISFSIESGKTLGIVGESGSGKSVTSLTLMQLLPSSKGTHINGHALFNPKNGGQVDLIGLSEEDIRKYRGSDMAMIFQEPMTSLNPVFTCGNQVAEAIKLHQKVSSKEARLKTIELFKKVKLPRPEQMFDAYPHQLSGGQKQRVMIAMAISCNPKVLIADEPTTALDVTVQASILDLLKELQQETGMAMIFITHDLGVISKIADEVIVMYKGNIVEQGQTKLVLENPLHPYTKGLLSCRPSSNINLKKLPTVTDFMKINEDGTFSETGITITQLRNELLLTEEDRNCQKIKIEGQENILSVKDLVVSFPTSKNIFGKVTSSFTAVDHLSFNVRKGETLGVVGESGCGKTTLGRAILRLVDATSGEVNFEGNNILKYSDKEMRWLRKKMQLVFQDPYSSLNPRLKIAEAITEPMIVHSIGANREERIHLTEQLLKKVGLTSDAMNKYPHQFSGGQRQRICIARALSVQPSFLICDESVSALDVSVQAQVLNLLNELKEENNLTYIFISHDLSVVRYMSDTMIVMKNGKIEEMGEARAVYEDPRSAYTRNLLSSIPH